MSSIAQEAESGFDLSRVIGRVAVQTCLRVGTNLTFSFGASMFGHELAHLLARRYRPLTAADVPTLELPDADHDFCVRDDGAIVQRGSVLVWGHLDGSGGIKWASKDKGDAWVKGMRFLAQQAASQS